jgi:hypothetical protein
LVVSILAAGPASAKSVDGLRAQIPFDFHVGDRVIPAGDYVVSAMTDDEKTLRIRAAGGGESAATLTSPKLAKSGSESAPRLVFHRYGDQYFLSAVWGDGETGRALPESKQERSLRRELRVARDARVQTVTIAAR